jgi:hypothetical protein
MTWIDDMKLLDLSGVNAAETTKKYETLYICSLAKNVRWNAAQAGHLNDFSFNNK